MPIRKKKEKNSSTDNKRRKLGNKSEKKTLETKKIDKTPVSNDSDSDTQESKSEKIQKLLEPYSKEQLIEFLCDASVSDSSLLNRIRSTADQDVSHRKIFVHGLAWDTTRETLLSAFQSYGEIEECKLVVDRVTGKAKGYGFVVFKSRTSAVKALKEPQKKINNRFAACQLASIGPVPPPQQMDTTGRKVYVSNVHPDADAEKLRVMFAKFGEIETGPMGFDVQTGKSRGFALFLYKTQEGAKKALEEPYKMFDGHQLHCQYASKPGMQQQQQLPQQPLHPSALAAAAAAQNLALFSQHPSLNPAYNGLLLNPNAGLMNPLFQGGFNPGAIQPSQYPGTSMGLGGYGSSHGMGLLEGGSSHTSMDPSLQGLYPYQSSQQYLAQSSRAHGFGGPLSGYPSYMW